MISPHQYQIEQGASSGTRIHTFTSLFQHSIESLSKGNQGKQKIKDTEIGNKEVKIAVLEDSMIFFFAWTKQNTVRIHKLTQ